MPRFFNRGHVSGLIRGRLGLRLPHPNTPKTAESRLNDTLEVVSALTSPAVAAQLAATLPKGAVGRAVISEEISLGWWGSKNSLAVKARRHVIRAVLLAARRDGASPARLRALRNELEGMSEERLLGALSRRLGTMVGNQTARPDWSPDNFTDPRNHDAQQFRYIVSAIKGVPTSIASLNVPDLGTQRQKDYEALVQRYKDEFDDIDPTIVEDVELSSFRNQAGVAARNFKMHFYKVAFKNPDFVKTNLNSTSVIDQDHRATFTPYGLILRVPESDIGPAGPQDLGITNRPDDVTSALQEEFEKTGFFLPSPNQILDKTTGVEGAYHYNEVVVAGSDGVEVTAIFVKVDSAGRIYRGEKQNDLNADVAALIKATGLPVVAILDDAGIGGGPPATDWFPNIVGLGP